MRWVCAVLVAVAAATPVLASPASDAGYEAGRRYVDAGEYSLGMAFLGHAAAADPDSSSGHRARLLQILVLSARVGRSLSALSSYDRGLGSRPPATTAALRRQRDAIAAAGNRALRELLAASQGFRQHLPRRDDCRIELAPPETWSLKVIDAAEAKIERGRALTGTEREQYESQTFRLWLYLTLSQLYGCPGRDDGEVVGKVRAALAASETIDPWIALAGIVDNLAAVVNRSLLEGQMGRARVVHRELRSCVSALLLQAPPGEGIVARTEVEASVQRVYGEQRGAEWFHDLEFAARLVKAVR